MRGRRPVPCELRKGARNGCLCDLCVTRRREKQLAYRSRPEVREAERVWKRRWFSANRIRKAEYMREYRRRRKEGRARGEMAAWCKRARPVVWVPRSVGRPGLPEVWRCPCDPRQLHKAGEACQCGHVPPWAEAS